MNQELTDKQREIYGIITQYHRKNGYSPSQNEIAEMKGITRTAVRDYLKALKAKGYITYERRIARSVVAQNILP
jgi:DNA-binding FadR family transcriptional regulator